jgi:hypothetical protein
MTTSVYFADSTAAVDHGQQLEAIRRLHSARGVATAMAGRFGEQPTVGSAAGASPLASWGRQLELADSLRTIVDAALPAAETCPVDQARIAAARALLDEVFARLDGPAAVRVHGMALLGLLLCDTAGPLYDHGRGDLRTALDEVLAAL